jgi:hypothetical protein
MQSCKRHTAKIIIEQLRQDGKDWILNLLTFHKKKHKTESEHQVWQEGCYPKQILSVEMLNQKSEYIHYNPVRRGYVSEPEHWIYSSAGDYPDLFINIRFPEKRAGKRRDPGYA